MINEEKARLVAEALSIAPLVDKVTQMICDDGINLSNQLQPTQKNKDMSKYHFERDYMMFKHPTFVEYTVYNFRNQQICDQQVGKVEEINRFNPQTGRISVTLYAVNKRLYPQYCEDDVRHEIMHYYEWVKKISNGVDPTISTPIDDSCHYATWMIEKWGKWGILQGEIPPNAKAESTPPTQEQLNVAWIMYYSHWSEQSSMVNAFPTQARNSPMRYSAHDTQAERSFKSYKAKIEWLERELKQGNPKVIAAVNEYNDFGFGTRNILTYAKKNFNRLKNKLNHARASMLGEFGFHSTERKYLDEFALRERIKGMVEDLIRNKQVY